MLCCIEEFVYDNVYIHYVVWEEIGDVLHGLGEDMGWTSKPETV